MWACIETGPLKEYSIMQAHPPSHALQRPPTIRRMANGVTRLLAGFLPQPTWLPFKTIEGSHLYFLCVSTKQEAREYVQPAFPFWFAMPTLYIYITIL